MNIDSKVVELLNRTPNRVVLKYTVDDGVYLSAYSDAKRIIPEKMIQEMASYLAKKVEFKDAFRHSSFSRDIWAQVWMFNERELSEAMMEAYFLGQQDVMRRAPRVYFEEPVKP